MFVRSKPKNRVFEFDYQKMNTFKFVQCPKNAIRVSLLSNSENLVLGPSTFEFDV